MAALSSMSGWMSGAMSGPFVGRFLDGVTATPQEVSVTVEEDVVVARRTAGYTDELLRWPRARITRAPLDGARVTLSSPEAEDALLEISVEAADALLGPGVNGPGGQRPRRRLYAAYAAGCVTVAAALYLGATPLSRAIAQRVPASVEAQLGQGLQLMVAKQYCETPAARASLDKLARRLANDRPTLVVHVLDTSMVNAFTFPGGTVVVSRGLLSEAENPDEVAGVLAHELEHVARRHVMVHLVRSSLLTALWQAAVGDYSGFMIVDPKTAVDIASLRFSRDDEREADRGALHRLEVGAISREGLRRFFDRMREKTDGVPAWLSNHPASAERAATIAAAPVTAAPAAGRTSPALDTADWQALRDACGRGAQPKPAH
jgi:Zn-dependent protease with chaperone function